MDDPVLLKINEAAAKLRVSPSTIRTLCNERKLAYIRPSGNPNGARRVLADSLDQYIRTQTVSDRPEVLNFPDPQFDDSDHELRERIKRLRKIKSS